jgi:hypothetical protein
MPKTKSSSQPAACSVRARGLRGSSSLVDKRIEGKDRSESSLEIRQPLKRKAESVSEVYLSISIRLTKFPHPLFQSSDLSSTMAHSDFQGESDALPS